MLAKVRRNEAEFIDICYLVMNAVNMCDYVFVIAL